MSPRPADRPLRKLVAELAAMRSDDVEAILADLSGDQRARVNALLAEYRGIAPRSPALAAAPAPDVIEGLSDWLAVRIRAAASQADSLSWPQLSMTDFAMTEAGRAALLAAAAKAQAAHPARTVMRKPSDSSSSLSGFLSLLRGVR
jgi:hypothetical protein